MFNVPKKYICLLLVSGCFFGAVVAMESQRSMMTEMEAGDRSSRSTMSEALAEQCGICFDTDHENPLQSLSCHPSHKFHKACIDEWKRVDQTCPVCRADLSSFCQKLARNKLLVATGVGTLAYLTFCGAVFYNLSIHAMQDTCPADF